jgi:hypothetical protein
VSKCRGVHAIAENGSRHGLNLLIITSKYGERADATSVSASNFGSQCTPRPAQLAAHQTRNTRTYRRRQSALVDQVLAKPQNHVHLFLEREPRDGRLDDAADARLVHGDEALVVHEGERAHDELTVHAVGDAAVARDGVAKVLDVEGALDAGGEEAAEGCDQGGEGGQDQDVELQRLDLEAGWDAGPGGQGVGELVVVLDEDGVDLAAEAGEEVGSQVLVR